MTNYDSAKICEFCGKQFKFCGMLRDIRKHFCDDLRVLRETVRVLRGIT